MLRPFGVVLVAMLLVNVALVELVSWGRRPAGAPPAHRVDKAQWSSSTHFSDVRSLPLRVRNVKMEPAAPLDGLPSVTVRFDTLNHGARSVTNIVLKVSVINVRGSGRKRSVVAGPYTIRGAVVLRPGYTLGYELRLRNLSYECGCVPNVDVVSAEALSGPGSL